VALRSLELSSLQIKKSYARTLVCSVTALHTLSKLSIVLTEQLAEFLTLHANFSETKAYALKSFYTFYTLDLLF